MKALAYTFVFLLSLTLIEVRTAAQNRKSRVGQRVPVSKSGGIQETELKPLTQSDKIVTECEIPDRPRPQVEIKQLSQLCGHALSLPKPAYPEEAKSKKVSGTVQVDVITNEAGRVIWAKAVSGPDLLQVVSMKAACRARYSPTLVSGRAVKTATSIQYSFVLP